MAAWKVAVLGTRYADLGIEESILGPLGASFVLGDGGSAEEILEVAGDADVVLAGSRPRFDARVIAGLRGRGIVRYGIGVDSIDLDAARAHGIAVARVSDYGTEAVAFHAVTAAMALFRRLPDADRALRDAVPSNMVRGFLLQSLVREGLGEGGGWRWRLNLDLLERDLDRLRGWPEPPPGARYDGPVLWIAGANSTYVLPEDRDRMDALFPATRLVRVKGAGHWVHSEQPEIFLETLRRFLDRVE